MSQAYPVKVEDVDLPENALVVNLAAMGIWTYVAGLELLQRILNRQIERLLVVADMISRFIFAQSIGFVARSVLGCDDLRREMRTVFLPAGTDLLTIWSRLPRASIHSPIHCSDSSFSA